LFNWEIGKLKPLNFGDQIMNSKFLIPRESKFNAFTHSFHIPYFFQFDILSFHLSHLRISRFRN